MEFREQYKNKGADHYANKKRDKYTKPEKFRINCLNYKCDEYTIKNKDYNPKRSFIHSKLKNKNNWDDFEMPSLSHYKYIRLNQICPCCSHGYQTHKLI